MNHTFSRYQDRKMRNDAASDNNANFLLLQETTTACLEGKLTLREYETLWGPPEPPYAA